MSPKLSLSNLSKSFGNVRVLDNLSLTLQNGAFVSVIGPSGCGKTTLFDIIAGVEKETSGTVIIDGKDSGKRLGKAGYMPQKPLLLPWRTVEENICLGLDIKGKNHESRIMNQEEEREKTAKEKARDLLEEFGLSEFRHFYPAKLSGGMAQRIALLRTILFHQDFLLLDEPFGALDALTRLSCQCWLLDVWEKFHPSVLFITHDIREAIFLSDRISVFSPRPSRIIEEIQVPLPRPRKPEQMTEKKAGEIEKRLLQLLTS